MGGVEGGRYLDRWGEGTTAKKEKEKVEVCRIGQGQSKALAVVFLVCSFLVVILLYFFFFSDIGIDGVVVQNRDFLFHPYQRGIPGRLGHLKPPPLSSSSSSSSNPFPSPSPSSSSSSDSSPKLRSPAPARDSAASSLETGP